MDIRSNTSIPSLPPEDRQRVECIHCNHLNEISRKAISAVCSSCRKALRLEEVRIKDYQARRVVETCSTVTVERKGDLRAEKIICAGAILRGKTKGDVTSSGPVLIGPEAELLGSVTAPTIAIPAGAILEGFYRIGPGSRQRNESAEVTGQAA
jgi:hypothetical protein